MPTRSPVLRVLGWTLAIVGAVGVAVVLAGPVTLALRGVGFQVQTASAFRRLLTATILGVLVVGLHPWRDRPPGTWGLHGPDARPGHVLLGVAIAVALLGALTAWQWAEGWFRVDEWSGRRKLLTRLPMLVVVAATVAVIEEVFFRGWALERFRRRVSTFAAAAATSVLFALPHLFKEGNAPKDLPADLSGAWAALHAWALSAIDLPVAAPKMLGMFLFGLALSASFLRTRSLWLGIGLHSGAVLFVQALSAFTDRTPDRNWAGSKWLYDGPPGWVAIGLLTLLLWPRRAARDLGADAETAAARTPPSV